MALSSSHLRLYMNLAAAFLFAVSLGSLVGVGVLTNLILSDENGSVSIVAIWLSAGKAVLSMVAAAWCRLHALRADADSKNSPPLDDPDEISAALLKGIERRKGADTPYQLVFFHGLTEPAAAPPGSRLIPLIFNEADADLAVSTLAANDLASADSKTTAIRYLELLRSR